MAPKQVLHRSSIDGASDESIVLVLLTLQDRMSLPAEKQDGLRFLFELLNPATLYSIKSLIGASVRHRLDDEQIALDVFCDMTPYLLGERPFKNASLNGLLSLCRKIAKSKVINEVTKIGRLRRQEPIMQSLIGELQEKTREAPDQIAEWREEVENWIQKLNSPELSAVLVYRMEGLSIGMNLILVETTQIASGTELLKLSRQTEPFKAEFPSSRESLEKLANELDKCDLSLKLYSKPKVPFGETHLSKLHVFTDFSIPFLQGSSNTLDLTEIRVDATKPDRRVCDLSKGGVQFHGEFEKFQGNWRLLHSSQQSRPASSRSQQKKEDIVSRLISVCDIKYVNQNGFEVTSKSEAIYSSGKKGGSTSNMVATGMTFGGTVNALLTEVIPNGTRVFLDGQEQIKAVWQDGKVVRVYHKGTIDDLSQSQFASTGGRNFETYFWLLLCFIAIPLIVVILNRLNRKKKQQPGFRSIP